MITLVFIAMKTSGDPRFAVFANGHSISPEGWDWAVKLGLDRPILIQYASWILGAVKGDYGDSITDFTPASEIAATRLPGTLKLLLGGLAASIAFTALTMSLFLNRRPLKLDYVGKSLQKIGSTVPSFLLGIFVLLVFAEWTGWTSAIEQQGWDDRLILASVTLGIFMAYGMTRLLIPAVMHAKTEQCTVSSGESRQTETASFWARVGKFALSRLLSSSPVWLQNILTATIILEIVFWLPGLSGLAFQAADYYYYPDIWVVFAAITWLTAAYAAVLFASEVVRAFIDPRIRRSAVSEAPA